MLGVRFSQIWSALSAAEAGRPASPVPSVIPLTEPPPASIMDAKPAEDFLNTPKNYTLLNAREEKSSDVHFYVFGCQGSADDNQRAVAKLMHDTAQKNAKKPKFIVILGDNVYDNGVDKENDPAFKKYFDDIYLNQQLTQLHGVPCFVVLGNHDHNLHNGIRGYWYGKADGFKKAAAQIQHTFLEGNVISAEKRKLYEAESLDLKELPAWNMPRRYYSCVIPGDNKEENALEMYFLDSSFFIRDYLHSLSTEKDNPNNQVIWLTNLAKKNKKAVRLAFMHHMCLPKNDAPDKRFNGDENRIYLNSEELDKLKALGIVGNYNEMLDIIFRKLDLHFAATISAHTHGMYYSFKEEKEMRFCRVGAGGGGGKLDARHNFSNRSVMPCFLGHGFVGVSVNLQNEKVSFDFYTTQQHHLKFENKSARFLRAPGAEEKEGAEVRLLRKAMMAACDDYYEFLAKAPVFKFSIQGNFGMDKLRHWGAYGSVSSEYVDKIICAFNRYEPWSMNNLLAYLREINMAANPLKDYLNEKLRLFCGVTYADFEGGATLTECSLDTSLAEEPLIVGSQGSISLVPVPPVSSPLLGARK